MKRKGWDNINLLSGTSDIHMYKNHGKKYYIIGNQKSDKNCEIKHKCDQLGKYPVGENCTTIEALLDNWLKYNNLYKLGTNLYLDVPDEKLSQYFESGTKKCFMRENKCPYYPYINIDINSYQYLSNLYLTISQMNVPDSKVDETILSISRTLTDLFQYYESLGQMFDYHYEYKNEIFKFKDEYKLRQLINLPTLDYMNKKLDINRKVKMVGEKLYFDYLEKIKDIHYINDGELFLILNQIKNKKKEWDFFLEFVNHYIILVNPLITMLWELNVISKMIINDETTHIVFTNNVGLFTSFFKDYKDLINLTSNDNCITIKPKDIHADEFRWTLFKNTQAKTEVNIEVIKNFKLTIRPQRAGVILYTYYNDVLYFGFGVDTVYHELTDFGGHLDRSDKNAITGALRELKEESLNVFNFDYVDVMEDIIVYDDKMAILFVHTNLSPKEVNDKFKLKLKTARKPEVNDIKWLSLIELKDELSLDHGKIYNRVKDHLIKGGEFYNYLQ